MSLPTPSILSEIASQLATFIHTSVNGRPQVRIGPPADAEPTDNNSEPIINLFLYRIEPSGFYPDATVTDPLYVRIHCIVTAYSSATAESDGNGTQTMVSAGEINLRLLGSLVQLFHEQPVHDIIFRRTRPDDGAVEEIRTALQVVFKPLSSEEINQIWATQGDTAYRASLAYELALAPVTPWMQPDIADPVSAALVSVQNKEPASANGGETGNGAASPALNVISSREAALIQAGKDTPPELPPELRHAGASGSFRRIVHGWLEQPNGGAPEFKTEADAIDLVFAPHDGLTGHSLSIYERQGNDWRRIDQTDLSGPPPSDDSIAITFPVIKQPGEWMFYVESDFPAAGEPTAILRSNIATLEVRQVSEPFTGGGSP